MSITCKILRGHTCPETAYLVNDYPYGEPICCGVPMIKGSNNFVCAKCSRIETFNIAEAAANFTKSSLANPGVGANADENNAPKI